MQVEPPHVFELPYGTCLQKWAIIRFLVSDFAAVLGGFHPPFASSRWMRRMRGRESCWSRGNQDYLKNACPLWNPTVHHTRMLHWSEYQVQYSALYLTMYGRTVYNFTALSTRRSTHALINWLLPYSSYSSSSFSLPGMILIIHKQTRNSEYLKGVESINQWNGTNSSSWKRRMEGEERWWEVKRSVLIAWPPIRIRHAKTH